jgi:hypothetical protein
MITPSTGTTPHMADQYDVSLIIPGPTGMPLHLPTLGVSCTHLLLAQGFHALIGRDVLAQCVVTYNGTQAWLTVAY